MSCLGCRCFSISETDIYVICVTSPAFGELHPHVQYAIPNIPVNREVASDS